jgi:pyruvate dehydrogenase E2 component (dihydrolipoamide acetyltransferase)
MAKIIGLPKLSPTMEEGTLVRWVKQEGDDVEVDDLVAEVETDKATMEFRAFDKGVLLKQLAAEGTVLKPDQPVAIFGKRGEDVSGLAAGGDGGSSSSAAPAEPAPSPVSAAASGSAPAGRASPAAGEPAGHAASGRVLASPVVRKIARERELDLGSIAGTGPHGRVTKRDVNGAPGRGDASRVGLPGAALRGPSAPPPAARPTPKVAEPPPPPATINVVQVLPASGDREEKLSPMRKTIARRLSESKREVPHFYLTIDVDAEPIVALRAQLNAELPPDAAKLSINDLLIKAVAVALRRMPRVNTSFAGDSIVYHDGVHISVAVAIPDGLVTPVVRDADRIGVLEISRTVRELAGRAKEKKLKPEEMTGGTFSISNLGMYGIDSFSAVINPPEGAILAVGAVRDEPVVKNGAVVAGKRLALTMSCDHRVIDGALGAEWLRLLRSLLEAPHRLWL